MAKAKQKGYYMKNDNELYTILQKDLEKCSKDDRDKLYNAGLIGSDGKAIKKGIWKLYKRLKKSGVLK